MTPRRLLFVRVQLAMLLAVAVSLFLLRSFQFDLFFLLSLVGFMVLTELTATYKVTPRWRSRINWIIIVGLAGFALIIIAQLLAILRAFV